MMNIVLDCNDRLGRKVCILASGGAWIMEPNEPAPTPFTCIHSVVAVDILNACLEAQVSPQDIRDLTI